MPSSVIFTVYAVESALLGTSVFKVYVTEDALHFGRVSDRFWPEHTKGGQKFLDMEERYSSLQPGSPEFLAADKRNISATREGIQGIKLNPVPSWMVQPGRIGYLDLLLSNGKKRKFMLAGSAGPEEVERAIRVAIPEAQGSLS